MSDFNLERTERLRFEVAAVGLAVYPPGATFGPRVLRDYEMVWMLDGDSVWECDGVARGVPPGTALLARPGMRDFFRWDPARQTRHAFFHFKLDRRGAVLPPEKDWPLLRRLPEGDVFRPLFRHLAWLLEARDGAFRISDFGFRIDRRGSRGPAEGNPSAGRRNRELPPGTAPHRPRDFFPHGLSKSEIRDPKSEISWDPLIQGALRHLFLCFLTGALRTKGEGGAELPAPVEKALRFVQERWSRGTASAPALPDLARAAAVTPVHLCRLFKRSVGCGPIEALRLVRLDRAATLLARSNVRVKEAADLAGFQSLYHFSRRFRETYGLSPRAFRKNLDAGAPMPAPRLLQVRRLSNRIWG